MWAPEVDGRAIVSALAQHCLRLHGCLLKCSTFHRINMTMVIGRFCVGRLLIEFTSNSRAVFLNERHFDLQSRR
jgi:hypothetical protein